MKVSTSRVLVAFSFGKCILLHNPRLLECRSSNQCYCDSQQYSSNAPPRFTHERRRLTTTSMKILMAQIIRCHAEVFSGIVICRNIPVLFDLNVNWLQKIHMPMHMRMPMLMLMLMLMLLLLLLLLFWLWLLLLLSLSLLLLLSLSLLLVSCE